MNKGIKSSYARASQAQVRAKESTFKSKTITSDRDLDIADEKRRMERFENTINTGLKMAGLSKDYRAAQKREENIKTGQNMYNQLNPDNKITNTKVTFKNYKDLDKTIFDVGTSLRVNQEGVEFTGGDLDAIANYINNDKKYSSIIDSIGEDAGKRILKQDVLDATGGTGIL